MYWADEIRELGRDERAALSRGPFLCDPNGRLMLINELLRREPGDPLRRFPQGPSLGWVRLEISHDSALEVWCPLGGEKVICEGSLPGQVISAEKGTLDLNHTRVMTLLSSGEAFLFNNMLFLLPRKGFAWNSFHYHPSGFDEPMSVAIGFRGHARNYLEVLTPSVLRQHMQPSKEKYLSYKKVETYAANVVKELFWARDSLALTDIQARGILQRAVIASPVEFLRVPASDSGDRVYTGRGSSAFVLQTVVSRVRPVEPHAQQFGLSRSCSQSLPEGGLAPRFVGVGQHLLALLAFERSVQGRQRGCTPWAFGPSISRSCRWVTRSAPGLSARVLRSTAAGGDRRFEHRWRGAEPSLTSSNGVGLPRTSAEPAAPCEGLPSRTETRTVRTTLRLQRTLELFSPVVICKGWWLRGTEAACNGRR